MTTARGHLSSETIDLLLLSALQANEANAAKQHIDACPTCKERWRELNDDKQRFEQFVFARTLPKVEARVAQERAGFFERFRLSFLVPAIGLAAAAVAAVVVLQSGPGTQTEDDIYIGVKGGKPSLEVFALRGDGAAFEVKPGAQLQPKDRIRFVVNPASAKYLLIASKDGAGAFSVYYPFGAQQSERLEASVPKRVELPKAVELDATLGTERLVAVFSDAPVKAADVEAALKTNASAPKIEGAQVVSWEFVKAAP